MGNLKLFRFFADCGRMGDLDGLFIATQCQVNQIIGKEVYFGEILGKHSEVVIDVGGDNFEVVSDDQDKILWLQSLLGTSLSGYNPLDYYEPEPEDDESADEENEDA